MCRETEGDVALVSRRVFGPNGIVLVVCVLFSDTKIITIPYVNSFELGFYCVFTRFSTFSYFCIFQAELST